jgi:myo-inositol-1-phosphate synthase
MRTAAQHFLSYLLDKNCQMRCHNLPKIRVALIGVGNCASALVQGLRYYGTCEKEEECLGLRNLVLGGFRAEDIEIAAAFDIDSRKVGKDLSEAIFALPNNVSKLADVPVTDVVVHKGAVLDGVGEYTRNVVQISDHPQTNVAMILKEANTEVALNLLPSGAVKASQWYAEQALISGCAFVNAAPSFIASDVGWAQRFAMAELPIAGDDLIDQVGATTLHKMLLQLLSSSGVHITETYQLDVGGGTESLDTLDRTRDIKRVVKTKTVEAALPYQAAVVAGSTDYVDFLQNRRDSYFWIRGVHFCNAPMQMDLKLSTVDAPNAGSMLLDVIRAMKIALDRRMKGAVLPICAYGFKHPPRLVSPEASEKMFAEFVSQSE